VKRTYSSLRGTSDFSPAQSLIFNQVKQKARQIFKIFGYREIILPILEEKGLFVKSVGETTDIAQRQMFKIEGKDAVLRPEGTAQIVRYYIQNSLHKQSDFHKFFYIGPMFRGERPQKGRLRQFHHLGAEGLGSSSIYLDAEMIDLSLKILEASGIKEKTLLLNSLGCKADKDKFSRRLKTEFTKQKDKLCDDCRKRLDKNPLRILDCKKGCRNDYIKQAGGHFIDLCPKCQQDFKDLTKLLDELGVGYDLDFCLVRGLDYYTNTVFEITSSKLGAQDAIGAGGRYNNLVKSLGGPEIPAVGFALGLERMLLVLDKKGKGPKVTVFVAVTGESLRGPAFEILNSLRKEGIASDYDYCQKSLKGQLRFAQKKGASFVIIVGDDEFKQGCVLVKDMEKGTQKKVKIGDLCSELIPVAS
jgi:histidyl-tRNA synthetase